MSRSEGTLNRRCRLANVPVLATSRIRAESQLEFEIIGSFSGYSWSNSEMRLLSISRMTEWVRRAVCRLWSKLDLRSSGSELAGIAADACRPRHELVVENAVLRHQLNVLRRHVKRPALGPIDRLKLVFIGATLLPSWRGAIAIVQPDTILRWHRAGFRLFWRCRSRPRRGSPLPAETVETHSRHGPPRSTLGR